MIIWHVKDPWSVSLAWVLSAKLNASTGVRIVRAQVPPGNWASKLPAVIDIRLYGVALKRDTNFRGMY
ncbi:hypothetical protein TNCV_3112401 [Trichonephila clavipes]|nr:hypothetical protein TNCV_3112401 [Trichonephila clavipes]